MRVRISFTVGLDEIPEKASKLISESSTDLQNVSETLNDLSINLVTDKQTVSTIKEIDTLRQKLFKIDSLLEDTSNILVGYEKTLLGISEEEIEGDSTDELEEG